MRSKTIISLTIICALLVGGVWYLYTRTVDVDDGAITSFEECAQYYAVMESYPARCATKSGKSFTQDIGNELEKTNLIHIDTPRPTATVSSPLLVSGMARGYWFFEASFPVELRDEAGTVIAQGIAQAGSEWMTEDFVPYSVTLTFTQPTTKNGTLTLHKDNPSGDPVHDDALVVPVEF